jgi:hypothetical protein
MLNLTDERTPFDIFVGRACTSIRPRLFYETGVTRHPQRLYKRNDMREFYGTGLRIVTASGVASGRPAHGKEGSFSAIFIGYPLNSSPRLGRSTAPRFIPPSWRGTAGVPDIIRV